MAKKSSRPTTSELRIQDECKQKQRADAAEKAATRLVEAQTRLVFRQQLFVRIMGSL